MRRLMTTIALALAALAGPVAAQVTTIDPNRAIDGDLRNPPAPRPTPAPTPAPLAPDERPVPQDQSANVPPQDVPPPDVPPTTGPTYDKGDVLAAAEGTFGKGAKGLADMIEKILSKQGRPNAYIAGKEASGAFVVGARYGSGVLSHKVAGDQKIYWRGPSVGFDVGGDATKVFMLVYNLYDTEDAYKRFVGAEGRLYFVGGFSATYLRRGDVVIIPVRLGVGWRAGVNAGYVKFRHKGTWVPF
ncbi:MAG: DUF1134 domain-containing protein [Sphingomonas sp.]|uniref:DUF1134 domain-containing protein n=1 Tax=Sphingomonas sp. TaxID=28214 RepID=UPI0012041B78|nr:DUF1134 domain-containing protein [Sphingomonas sp.]THD38328.1 MAG: DUF1134 domain-containing protein [Sphingomonas sp.]